MKAKQKQIYILICAMLCLLLMFTGCSEDISDSGFLSDVSNGNTKEQQEDAEAVDIDYTFRNAELFDSHYKKHGAEFGDITQEEYLQLANKLINSETALRKTEKEDGDLVLYEESENMFLVFSTDGYIRTFFKPDDGLDYFERQ